MVPVCVKYSTAVVSIVVSIQIVYCKGCAVVISHEVELCWIRNRSSTWNRSCALSRGYNGVPMSPPNHPSIRRRRICTHHCEIIPNDGKGEWCLHNHCKSGQASCKELKRKMSRMWIKVSDNKKKSPSQSYELPHSSNNKGTHYQGNKDTNSLA